MFHCDAWLSTRVGRRFVGRAWRDVVTPSVASSEGDTSVAILSNVAARFEAVQRGRMLDVAEQQGNPLATARLSFFVYVAPDTY